ncbi:MAG: ATP-binding protein, partial [bacterium]
NHIQHYRNKVSGPLLDRIDIHIEVPSVRYQELSAVSKGEKSAVIRERVVLARGVQSERFKGARKVTCNATMRSKDIQKYCALKQESQDMLKMAMTELHFSARAYDRILKVSRTIADLSGSGEIKPEHVSEAIQYRTLDRNLWI